MTQKPRIYPIDWYIARRDRDMEAARNWQARFRNDGDHGCLEQMRVWVRFARHANHHALERRRQESGR